MTSAAPSLFVAPLAAVLMAVAVFPVVYSFYISLFIGEADAAGADAVRRPRQLRHRAVRPAVLACGRAHRLLRRASAVVAIAVLALLVALLLNEDFPGRRVLSAVLLVPWAIPYVANALMWKWIYDSNYGALERAAVPARLHRHLHGLARRRRQDAGADRQRLRLEGGAAGRDPAAGRPEDDPRRPVRGRKGRRRQRHAAASSTSPCRR